MSITFTGTDLGTLKAAQHQTWSSGDYGSIAWITVPLAHELVAAVDLVSGSSVLDVATGTGRNRHRTGVLPDQRDRLRRRAHRHRHPPSGRRGPGHRLRV